MPWRRWTICLVAAALVTQLVAGLRGQQDLPQGAAGSSDAVASSKPADRQEPSFATDILPFLKQHCFHCHGKGDGQNEADLTLSRYTDDLSVQQDRKVWDNVLHMLRAGEMPPKERPRPPAAQVEAVIRAIEAVLARLDCAKPQNVGRVTLRRLNRVEYNNTIRDLVGVDFQPAADFPQDDVGYGFDNIGDVLSTTPLLFERYLAAAESILQKVIVLPELPEPKDIRLQSFRVSNSAGETTPGGAVLYAAGEVSSESYLDAGDWHIQVEVYAKQVGDEKVRTAILVNRQKVQELEVTATDRNQPQTIEAKVRLPSGTARVGVALVNPYVAPDSTEADPKRRLLFVRSILLDGPHNPPPPPLPPSQQKLLAHTPGLEPREAAREIITRFATRAFRRPVTPEEVERILATYDAAEKEGERFDERLRLALCRVLVSPHFLFRIEVDPPGAKAGEAYPISELELASRLSYFLWSTMPDEELFELAVAGKLRENLTAQVKRMLADPKSSALVENFAGQWLTLRKLAQVSPDAQLFPEFDEDLRAAMQKETELFFEAILREDRSLLDLIDADFTFVNARLARHYGMSGIFGAHFRRVPAPPNRGGLLTQASILTLTSHPTRTSPVKRGKWVLEQLLGTPPPPPPPDVPDLDEKKQLTGTLRQVMEQHRVNPICASCHARMDPIGFAFENYDAIGRWRTKEGSFDIDPSGELPDGRRFQGPAELKQILKEKKDLFARSVTEKMLTYALGRGLEFYDQCAIDKIVAALAKNDYRFSTLVVEIVHSDPFQKRTATGERP
jgi:mono/diheme cytochrome c family protein